MSNFLLPLRFYNLIYLEWRTMMTDFYFSSISKTELCKIMMKWNELQRHITNKICIVWYAITYFICMQCIYWKQKYIWIFCEAFFYCVKMRWISRIATWINKCIKYLKFYFYVNRVCVWKNWQLPKQYRMQATKCFSLFQWNFNTLRIKIILTFVYSRIHTHNSYHL